MTLTGFVIWALVAMTAVVAAAVLIPVDMPVAVLARVVIGGVALLVDVLLLISLIRRTVAFRADPDGFTIGGGQSWQIPWADVQRVLIWRRPFFTFGQGKRQRTLGWVPMIGVQRRPGAPPPPRPARRDDRDLAELGAPGPPGRGIAVATAACRLDRERLARVIAAAAPGIPVVDATGAETLNAG